MSSVLKNESCEALIYKHGKFNLFFYPLMFLVAVKMLNKNIFYHKKCSKKMIISLN